MVKSFTILAFFYLLLYLYKNSVKIVPIDVSNKLSSIDNLYV